MVVAFRSSYSALSISPQLRAQGRRYLAVTESSVGGGVSSACRARRRQTEVAQQASRLRSGSLDSADTWMSLPPAVGRGDSQTLTLERLTRLRFSRERYRQQLERA
jgi:hypothetical protein